MTATLTLTTENAWLRRGLLPVQGQAKGCRCKWGPILRGPQRGQETPRGAWSVAAAGSRLGSRPPLSLHSPEARAGSPSAEVPRGRRLQRRGRRRIMPQRSWPGRVDPDPLGSARLAPVGPVCGKQQPSRRESPTPSLNSRDERPRNWTRRGQDAAPAPFRPHRPGLPGGGSGGGYGDLVQHRASKNSAVLGEEVAAFMARLLNGDSPERWPGRETRCLRGAARATSRSHVNSPGNASRLTIDEVSGD